MIALRVNAVPRRLCFYFIILLVTTRGFLRCDDANKTFYEKGNFIMPSGETGEAKIGKYKAQEEQRLSFDMVKKASKDRLSQQRDNPDRTKKTSDLFREYIACMKDIKTIQMEINELSKGSEIDFLRGAQRHLQIINAVDLIEVLDTTCKTLPAYEPSEEKRAMNKELLETYITNTRKRKDFLVKYKAMVVFQKSVEKAAAELVRDTSTRVEVLDVDLDPLDKKKRGSSQYFRVALGRDGR